MIKQETQNFQSAYLYQKLWPQFSSKRQIKQYKSKFRDRSVGTYFVSAFFFAIIQHVSHTYSSCCEPIIGPKVNTAIKRNKSNFQNAWVDALKRMSFADGTSELWLEIDQLHLKYLQHEDNVSKVNYFFDIPSVQEVVTHFM